MDITQTDVRSVRLRQLAANVDTWFGACGANEEAAAMVETAFLMAAADGTLQPTEYQQLIETIAAVTGDRIGLDRVKIVTGQLIEVLQLDGWEARLEAIARAIHAPDARRRAYRLAGGVSFVDGQIQDDEMQLFGLLAEVFEIPLDEASRILTEVRDAIFDVGGTEPILLLPSRRRSRAG